jgi:hypothetical protein
MPSPINLQCVNVKLLAKDPEGVELEPLIPVFHNWIQGQVFEELLLDVADYRHVHEGPGVVLIGHQANYSVDNRDNRLGLRYNRKAPLEGSNQDRLRQATRAALTAFQRLEGEAGLNGKLQFNGQEIEVFINDRLMAPNRDSTREAVKPELQDFFGSLFRGGDYALSHGSDPRALFGVYVKANRVFSVSELLANLAA